MPRARRLAWQKKARRGAALDRARLTRGVSDGHGTIFLRKFADRSSCTRFVCAASGSSSAQTPSAVREVERILSPHNPHVRPVAAEPRRRNCSASPRAQRSPSSLSDASTDSSLNLRDGDGCRALAWGAGKGSARRASTDRWFARAATKTGSNDSGSSCVLEMPSWRSDAARESISASCAAAERESLLVPTCNCARPSSSASFDSNASNWQTEVTHGSQSAGVQRPLLVRAARAPTSAGISMPVCVTSSVVSAVEQRSAAAMATDPSSRPIELCASVSVDKLDGHAPSLSTAPRVSAARAVMPQPSSCNAASPRGRTLSAATRRMRHASSRWALWARSRAVSGARAMGNMSTKVDIDVRAAFEFEVTWLSRKERRCDEKRNTYHAMRQQVNRRRHIASAPLGGWRGGSRTQTSAKATIASSPKRTSTAWTA